MLTYIYLVRCINLVQHNNTGHVVVMDETPEVYDGVREWHLSNDETITLGITLFKEKGVM